MQCITSSQDWAVQELRIIKLLGLHCPQFLKDVTKNTKINWNSESKRTTSRGVAERERKGKKQVEGGISAYNWITQHASSIWDWRRSYILEDCVSFWRWRCPKSKKSLCKAWSMNGHGHCNTKHSRLLSKRKNVGNFIAIKTFSYGAQKFLFGTSIHYSMALRLGDTRGGLQTPRTPVQGICSLLASVGVRYMQVCI